MSDEPTIPPALSAEQWKDALAVAIVPNGVSPGCVALFQMYCDEYGYATYASSSDLPKFIALANAALPDDSPNKITRADVAFLNEIAGALYSGAWSGPAERLAAKLAALLPPP